MRLTELVCGQNTCKKEFNTSNVESFPYVWSHVISRSVEDLLADCFCFYSAPKIDISHRPTGTDHRCRRGLCVLICKILSSWVPPPLSPGFP